MSGHDRRCKRCSYQRKARRRQRRSHSESIYVCASGYSAIKVGRTSNMTSRLAAFRTANPGIELVVEAKGIGSRAAELEGRIHAAYAAFRIQGEWFRPTDSLLQLVEAIADINDEDAIDASDVIEQHLERLEQPCE